MTDSPRPSPHDQLLLQLVNLPAEERNHEAKTSFPWRKPDGAHPDADLFADLKGKVTKTIMALANLPGGGRVVVGVGQEAGTGRLLQQGIAEDHLAGWNSDEVLGHVNGFASPEVKLAVAHVTDEAGRKFVVVSVQEFEEVPVVCGKDQGDRKDRPLLRRGATYVRARSRVETVEVYSQTETRELIDMATQKQLRKMLPYVRQLLQEIKPGPSDQDQFDDQLGELWA